MRKHTKVNFNASSIKIFLITKQTPPKSAFVQQLNVAISDLLTLCLLDNIHLSAECLNIT